MIIGIGYHYVRPSFDLPYPGIFGLTCAEFKAQLELLGRHGEFVGQSEMRRARVGEASPPERAWLVSFDDGLREQVEYALPVLEELGIPAVFFVNTQPLAEQKPALVHMTHQLLSHVSSADLMQTIETCCDVFGVQFAGVDESVARKQYRYDTPDTARVKYMLNFALTERNRQRVEDWCFDRLLGWDRAQVCADLYMSRRQLRDLADRGLLGSHSHSHRSFGTVSFEDARSDIRTSLDLIEAWTGIRVDTIGYPYGSHAACPVWLGEVGKGLGLTMGFTMERAGIDRHSHSLFLPRCAPNDLPGGTAPLWPENSVFDAIPSSGWYSYRTS